MHSFESSLDQTSAVTICPVSLSPHLNSSPNTVSERLLSFVFFGLIFMDDLFLFSKLLQ